jgi:hypothetical protein
VVPLALLDVSPQQVNVHDELLLKGTGSTDGSFMPFSDRPISGPDRDGIDKSMASFSFCSRTDNGLVIYKFLTFSMCSPRGQASSTIILPAGLGSSTFGKTGKWISSPGHCVLTVGNLFVFPFVPRHAGLIFPHSSIHDLSKLPKVT